MFYLRIILTSMQALRQNFLRTMLATLGVVIGVGAVVAAVSILEGSHQSLLDRFEALGADQLLVVNGSEDRSHHRRVQAASLTAEDADVIISENPELVAATAPQFTGAGQIKYLAKNKPVSVLGTTAAYASIHEYAISHGRFLTPQDVRGKGMVCVLGYAVADELFGALPAVGNRVKINGKTFMIVGVMEERGALGFLNADEQVIIPLTTAMNRMFGAKNVHMLVVQCTDADQTMACIEGVKRTLRASHRIRPGDPADFVVLTQEAMKSALGDFTKIFALVLYSIAGISTVVGAIGIMNIMLVSVTERTREIGVRIAVGARRMDILKQFLVEAGAISMLGAGFGGLCGWALANLISSVSPGGILEVYTRPMLVVIALSLGGIVGIISGIYPAIRAAKLDPVESLRYE